MKKLDGKSLDLSKKNINTLKKLFPEVVTEGKIDFDKLKLILGEEIDDRNERYEFTWHGKMKSMKITQAPSNGTLRPDIKTSKNWDTTENLYIEGDNLEVLKLLQKSYFGKIKMIYIDPPYNTGKDFVYKDNFHNNIKNYKELTNQSTKVNTETSGRYHTDWLNMMYPRLKLARNLLKDDGVIFLSIDENEITNLKKICDEIFGEMNLIITMVINRTSEIASNYTISKHEYLLVYAKNKDTVGIEGPTKYTISRGTVGNQNQTMPIITFPKGLKCYGLEDGVYHTTRKIQGSNENIENLDPIVIKNGELAEEVRLKARWRSSNDMRNFFANNCMPTKAKISGEIVEIYFENDRFNPQIKKKTFEKLPSLYLENKRGSKDLEKLGLNSYVEFPKSVGFIKYLLQYVADDSIILDFFSGSATTAHAVMQKNSEDGGNRKFIMVQLPELTDEKSEAYKSGYKNICEIGKERIRRAGDKIVRETEKKDLDIGFKVFKLDSSNIKLWDPETANLEQDLFDLQDNIKEGRTKEDLLYEILLKIGIPLTIPIEEVKVNDKVIYNVGFGGVLLCLEDEIDLEIVHEIIKLKPEDFDTKVIFKETGFINDSVKTNAIQSLKKNGITDVRSV